MNDESNTALETLDRWWADAPTGQPSLPQIAETRTRIRRRRRRNYLAAGALALVVAGGVSFSTTLGPDVDRREKLAKDPVDPPATQAVEALTASPGYRLVAFQVSKYTVAVEVPESWGSTLSGCTVPPRPVVQLVLESELARSLCPVPLAPGIAIVTGRTTPVRSPSVNRDLGEVTLEASPTNCLKSKPPQCGATASVTRNGVPPDGMPWDVALEASLTSMSAGIIFDRIWASARVLPSGYVAVPPPASGDPSAYAIALGDTTLKAGLTRLACPPNAACKYGVLDVSPAPGSIVAKGSMVTVTHY